MYAGFIFCWLKKTTKRARAKENHNQDSSARWTDIIRIWHTQTHAYAHNDCKKRSTANTRQPPKEILSIYFRALHGSFSFAINEHLCAHRTHNVVCFFYFVSSIFINHCAFCCCRSWSCFIILSFTFWIIHVRFVWTHSARIRYVLVPTLHSYTHKSHAQIILLLLMLDHEFIYTVHFTTYYLFASSEHRHTALYASKSILIFVLCLFVSFSLLVSMFAASSSSSLLSLIVRSAPVEYVVVVEEVFLLSFRIVNFILFLFAYKVIYFLHFQFGFDSENDEKRKIDRRNATTTTIELFIFRFRLYFIYLVLSLHWLVSKQ